jgi:hypothetical protein
MPEFSINEKKHSTATDFNYRRVFGSDGATAFALPTKFGQPLIVEEGATTK